MAFTTLEDRYNQVSQQIYNRFSPSSDQLVSVKPNTNGVFGSKSRIKSDSRLLPTVSFLRDTRRVTKFLTSSEGVLFASKQLLLQTGNTFVNTRVWGGPLTTLMIPGTHTTRHLDLNIGRGGSTLKQPISGRLQIPTTTPFTNASNLSTEQLLSAFRSETLAQRSTSVNKSTFLSPLKDLLGAITTPIESSTDPLYDRPEFKVYSRDGKDSYSPFIRDKQSLASRRLVRSKLFIPSSDNFDVLAVIYGSRRQSGIRTTDYYLNTSANSTGYSGLLSGVSNLYESTTTNKDVMQVNFSDKQSTRDYFRNKQFNYDKLNVSVAGPKLPGSTGKLRTIKYFNELSGTTRVINYNILKGEIEPTANETPDIINFAFQTQNETVRFRALISSLKQNVKPEFTEQRYVGRTERFVTYGGARRTANLQFNIVAFSEAELDAVWTKVNYLTGLAFPLGFSNSGFMVPPLFKISVGNIYDAQPCYIDNLDFDFIDEQITFDIDKQVSQYINVNMSIVLLEKRSRFYNSPFYEITQNLLDEKSSSRSPIPPYTPDTPLTRNALDQRLVERPL